MTRNCARALVGAALLATVGSGLVALPASAAGSGLHVELECVSAPLDDETTYLARFRVLNPGSGTVNLPAGEGANDFLPTSDVGQPTSFNPGWTTFETTFPAEGSVAWTLDSAAATATASSPACEYVYSGPVVIGTPSVGSTLTMAGERVDFAGDGYYDVLYQWWRDCDGTPEQVATGPQYVVQPSNVGERLGATITYRHGTHGIVLSSSCGPEATAGAGPTSSAAPSVVGTPKVGVPLSLSAATWAGSTPIDESVDWEVCDAATCVPAGSGPAYTPDTDDVGRSVRAVVTGSNGFGSGSVTTAAVGPVASAAAPSAAPHAEVVAHVVGAPRLGSVLSIAGGSWSGSAPISETIGWESCDDSVCRAVGTGPAYAPVAADLGRSLRAVVTATNVAGAQVVTTAAVGPVTAPPGPSPAAAALTLSTTRLDLGTVKVHKPGKARTVRISNVGGTPLVVQSIGVSGKHRKDVVLTTTCPGDTLAPGASCSVKLQLRPAAAGRRTAALMVTSTAPGGPARAALTGRGVRRR